MIASGKEKRKAPAKNNQDDAAKGRKKRQKFFDAREIRTEAFDAALNDRKELDVAKFVKSRESEIDALEAGITNAKSALATRAFQQVPRYLRRRSASHNVKRVPKRLRTRALKEKVEDNTPTVTSRKRERTANRRLREHIATQLMKQSQSENANRQVTARSHPVTSLPEVLETAPVLAKKFLKRQREKSWLPTHLFHAKRARMTPSHQTLWRFAIPLTPTEKNYRLNHRASTLRGCVAWDASYVGSIQLKGTQSSLMKIFEALSLPKDRLVGQVRWRWLQGLRTWSGWMYEHNDESSPIAPVVIFWNPEEDSAKLRQALIRVHPSAFFQLWHELMKLCKMQRPTVAIEDLRFALGSIEVTGPAATEALTQILRPVGPESRTAINWPSLASVTNLATLDRNVLLGFNIADPRTISAHSLKHSGKPKDSMEMLNIMADWPYDNERKSFELLDTISRVESCKNRLSEKTINTRRSRQLRKKESVGLELDPSIPVLLYISKRDGKDGLGDSWVVLLPWDHVSTVWSCLLQVSLSCGGQPRFGGLQEQRQLFLESKCPWFPGDFPGTNAGWEWELNDRERRKASWEKHPKAKRVCWETVDLGISTKGEVGRGWACDWEFLLQNKQVASKNTQNIRQDRETLSGSKVSSHINQGAVSHHGKSFNAALAMRSLVAVSLTLSNCGHISPCARIYRLTANSKHLEKWKGSAETSHTMKGTGRSGLLQNDSHQPDLSAANLIGFVTSGNYNLGEGQATAIGSILRRELEEKQGPGSNDLGKSGLCLVRDAGVSTCRLGRWQVCP